MASWTCGAILAFLIVCCAVSVWAVPEDSQQDSLDNEGQMVDKASSLSRRANNDDDKAKIRKLRGDLNSCKEKSKTCEAKYTDTQELLYESSARIATLTNQLKNLRNQ